MSRKFKNKFEAGQNTMHFFAANAFHWQAANDPRQLSDFFDSFKMNNQTIPWSLYLVPRPLESEYEIYNYEPQVEGLVRVGTYQPETAG